MTEADLVALCAEARQEECTESLSGCAPSGPAHAALRTQLARLGTMPAADARTALSSVLRTALARDVLPETARTLLDVLGEWPENEPEPGSADASASAASAATSGAGLWQMAAQELLALVCTEPMEARVRRAAAETLVGALDAGAGGAGAAALATAALDACVGAGTAERWTVHRGEPLAIVPPCVAVAEAAAAAAASATPASGAPAEASSAAPAAQLRARVEACLLEREWPAAGLVRIADLVKELLQSSSARTGTTGAAPMKGVVAKALARIGACDDAVLDAYLAQLHEISVQCRPHRARVLRAVVAFADQRERALTRKHAGSSPAHLARLRDAEQLVLSMVHYAAAQDEVYARDVVAAVSRLDPVRACPVALAVLLAVARLSRYEADVLRTLTRALLARDRLQASHARTRRLVHQDSISSSSSA